MDSNIYIEKYIKKDLSLDFNKLGKNIDEIVLQKLKDDFENKCNENGFIKKDSIELVQRMNGIVNQYIDLSIINFSVIFKCLICNPSPGLIIKCNVVESIKPGLICELFPLSIIVPNQLHSNKKIFNSINIGDSIEVKIMNSKFKKNEQEIQIVGILNEK